MAFFRDNIYFLILFVGIITLILTITTVSSSFFDFDASTSIEHNKTIELNGVKITVPESNNSIINESCSLKNVNDTEKFGFKESINITTGNAYSYIDKDNNISIYVADNNRTSYSDIPDFSELTTMDGELDRTHIEKKTLNDKTVLIYVTEGNDLSKRIINSAVPAWYVVKLKNNTAYPPKNLIFLNSKILKIKISP